MLNMIQALTSADILTYLILGLATFVEGPLTLLAAGAGIALEKLLPMPAFIAVVAGNLCADLGWYSLGRFGKPQWIKRALQKIHVNPRSIDRLCVDIHKHAPRLIFLSKLTVGLPIPTLIALGLNRAAMRRWAAHWIGAELVKSALLVALGYLCAGGIQQTYGVVRSVLWAFTIGLVLSAAIYFKLHKKRSCASPAGGRMV